MNKTWLIIAGLLVGGLIGFLVGNKYGDEVIYSNTGVLKIGEKLFIVERRFFKEDTRRHFIGELKAVQGDLIRIKGYVWIPNPLTGVFERRPELRERALSISPERYTTNVIPASVDLNNIRYVQDNSGHTKITDGNNFSLDITEFTSKYRQTSQ